MLLLPMRFEIGLIEVTLVRDTLTNQYEVKLAQDGDVLYTDVHYDHRVAVAVFNGLQAKAVRVNGFIDINQHEVHGT